MRVLLYECFSGIAGDMNLGALIDLGVPENHLRESLAHLELCDQFKLIVSRSEKCGIAGTLASVKCEQSNAHRHLKDIRGLIESSALTSSVKSTSIQVFERLAEAEGKVHDISPNKVHFHEVGAVDAIVDIVGAAIGLDYLKPDHVACGPVELGSGMVKCEHGNFPVPAPATAELLVGKPTTRGRVSGEATTPTGAAILATIVDSFQYPTDFRVESLGYGLGHKDFETPNAVRLSLGNVDSPLENETNVEIECNIDDMSPEAFGPLYDRLFDAGALDVFITPIHMKKSRPAHRLSVLANSTTAQQLIELVLQSTTSLGVRTHAVAKYMLPREHRLLQTRFGAVNVKVGTLPDGSKRWKVEHDDVQTIAVKQQLDYLAARTQIDEDIRRELN